MRKKVLILALMLVSSVMFIPEQSFAATAEKSTSIAVNNSAPQIRVQIGNRRNRRGRGWNRGRHRGWENRNRNRTRLVRQVYWRNGQRYVRYVRVRG